MDKVRGLTKANVQHIMDTELHEELQQIIDMAILGLEEGGEAMAAAVDEIQSLVTGGPIPVNEEAWEDEPEVELRDCLPGVPKDLSDQLMADLDAYKDMREVISSVEFECDDQAERWHNALQRAVTERDYQRVIWNDEHMRHADWVLVMERYIQIAKDVLSSNEDYSRKERHDLCMTAIRKITALGLAAMENHKTPERVL